MFRYKYLYLIASCGILTLAMQVSVFGEVRNVYKSDGAIGIQDSINVSGAGDTVLVHNGIYYVRDIDSVGITMQDSIVLMSSGGAEYCTLSGLDSTTTDTAYHVIYCYFGDSSSHAAVIRGFTITRGNANHYTDPHGDGGGIYCQKSSPTIHSCIITNNWAYDGGGIYIYYSSATLTNNTISDNLTGSGGGLYIYSSSPILTGNTIANNSATNCYGGGIYMYWHSSPVLTGNIVTNNWASKSGGGIYIRNSSPILTGNIIADNSAESGGGIYIKKFSSPILTKCVITANRGKIGAAIYDSLNSKTRVDSCFILDNGDTRNNRSGIAHVASDADTVEIINSHLYYNTFQPDTEIWNNTGVTLPLENNFWWDTTESGIAGLIEGPADFTPWEYDFIDGVPGEPTSIDSVRSYDSTYSIIIDSLWDDPDTLYLRIYGEDRNAEFREAAVAIIKSSIYPSGIAVALIETDTSSGVYEGKAIVKTSTETDNIRIDDIYQTIRVDSTCDSLQIVANMDTAQKFIVYYRVCPGVEESESRSGDLSHTRLFQNYPNPFTRKTVIRVRFSCSDQHEPPARITIYDLSGRLVRILPIPQSPNNPITSVSWDGKDKNGKMLGSGVYFYKLEAVDFAKTKKMFLIR